MKAPDDCTTIEDIREAIDALDHQILELFGKRYQYVEEIIKFKSDKESIVANDRQQFVFSQRKKWAEDFGLDPALFESIFKTLVNWNVQKELELLKRQQTTNV